MESPNYKKDVEKYDATDFYEFIGKMQTRYEIIRELFTRVKKQLKNQEKKRIFFCSISKNRN